VYLVYIVRVDVQVLAGTLNKKSLVYSRSSADNNDDEYDLEAQQQ
jgi:hypothetical protein